jgi:hypothetical protein
MLEEEYSIFYPNNIKKYSGSISERKDGKFRVEIYRKEGRKRAVLDSRSEAEAIIRATSIRQNNVKNVIYEYPTQLKILCSKDRYFICDKEDIKLVDSHIWTIDRNGYASTRILGRRKKFIELKLCYRNNGMYMIDHINGILHDHRSCNLEKITNRKYILKSDMMVDETTGIRGVHYSLCYDRYECTWLDKNGIKIFEYFPCAKYGKYRSKNLAKKKRMWVESHLPHYREILKNMC